MFQNAIFVREGFEFNAFSRGVYAHLFSRSYFGNISTIEHYFIIRHLPHLTAVHFSTFQYNTSKVTGHYNLTRYNKLWYNGTSSGGRSLVTTCFLQFTNNYCIRADTKENDMNTFATSVEYSVWACGNEVDRGLPFSVAKDIADELRVHQWDVRVCKSKQTHPELSKPKADGITLFCTPQ